MRLPLEATHESSALDSAGDIIETGAERARDVLGTIVERAHEALDSAEIEPHAVRLAAARALAGASDGDPRCAPAIEAAEDRLRLRTALVTGAVAFTLSALVLLAARAIARRRRARESRRARASRRRTPAQSSPVRGTAASES